MKSRRLLLPAVFTLLFAGSFHAWGQMYSEPQPYAGWHRYDTSHFTFYYAPDSSLAKPGKIEVFAGMRENAHSSICTFLGISPRSRIYFYAYDSDAIGRSYTGKNLGWAEPHNSIIHSRTNQSPGHEVCHIAVHWIRPRGADTPSWIISEGFATYMDMTGRDYIQEGFELLKQDRLPSLVDLAKASGRSRSYSAAASFVAFLMDSYGSSVFLRAERERWNSLEHFLRSAYGTNGSQMNQLWRSYLVEKAGATRVPSDGHNKPDTGRLSGRWNITYSNGGRRTYIFEDGGGVYFLEENRRGAAVYRERFIFIDFGDNKYEKWMPRDGRHEPYDVLHYYPKRNYPDKITCTGVAMQSR